MERELTKTSSKMIKDINKGQMILNQISKFDIGQSIIIQQGTVVGIEGVQGTDVNSTIQKYL